MTPQASSSNSNDTNPRLRLLNVRRIIACGILALVLEDPTAMEGFYREARACARLNHTNIIHIYSFDEYDGQRYLVMELADRGSLADESKQHSFKLCGARRGVVAGWRRISIG